jgi:hypothetical protein
MVRGDGSDLGDLIRCTGILSRGRINNSILTAFPFVLLPCSLNAYMNCAAIAEKQNLRLTPRYGHASKSRFPDWSASLTNRTRNSCSACAREDLERHIRRLPTMSFINIWSPSSLFLFVVPSVGCIDDSVFSIA